MNVKASENKQGLNSYLLKAALFATGLAGIVAEYVLSTLATYFLGDSVFQWALIVSMMLFSMGLGSRISQYFSTNLLQKFIYIEFTLSMLSSFAALFAYTVSAFSGYTGLMIYTLSMAVGLLIGMEIPLVIRLNNAFEQLRVNVSSVMEKDYYGSLAGGLFFAFVGLPYLGLTYTPFVLGTINFAVALLLLRLLWPAIDFHTQRKLGIAGAGVAALLVTGFIMAEPIVLFGEQRRYQDKVIYEQQTRYQKIIMTQWKDDYWLYLNGNQQLSTVDEEMYHEPLVHPVMQLTPNPQSILVLGGGDGCAARELLKYESVEQITLVDLDPEMTRLGKEHPVLREINEGAMQHPKVEVLNQDAFTFMDEQAGYYDVILVDLPDPRTVDLNRMYTVEFYRMCHRHLRPNGYMITQAGSPYYATRAFLCIDASMQEAGFGTLPLHNQILTMGEWGWIIGSRKKDNPLKQKALSLSFENTPTRWINSEAMQMMTSFGKNIYGVKTVPPEANTIQNAVLYRYYLNGNWDLY